MKVFLDDLRDPPDDTWILCRNTAQFMHLAKNTKKGDILSLDHDLGEYSITGYDVLTALETHVVIDGLWSQSGAPMIQVHSANPIGRDRMIQAINSIYRYLNL